MVDNFLKKELDINQVEVIDEDAPQQIVDENLINQNDPISRGDYLLGYVSLEANLIASSVCRRLIWRAST